MSVLLGLGWWGIVLCAVLAGVIAVWSWWIGKEDG